MRLIDADDLTQKFYRLTEVFGTESVHIDTIVDYIENMPTIDAEEMVRCEECMHSDECSREVLINEYDDDKDVDVTGFLFSCSYGWRQNHADQGGHGHFVQNAR